LNERTFGIVTRDEVWSLDRRSRVESRFLHGVAQESDRAIHARDQCDQDLLALCERRHGEVTAHLAKLGEGHARAVTSARRENGTVSVTATVSLTIMDVSLVTTIDHLLEDHRLLQTLAHVKPQTTVNGSAVPIVWRNGSAAVLLHEAAGHPAEHGHRKLGWPAWLAVTDDSPAGRADLLAGEKPHAMRRESFADVPLVRMTNVIVDAGPVTAVLPPQRLEVMLVASGRYEPLNELVSLSISVANWVDGDRTVRVNPMEAHWSRVDVAQSITSATGAGHRYPGVICSKEGQEVFVSSNAPDLVMQPR
jgi:hypothetical protein